MRIVAGIYGGRRLIRPQGNDIRPTSDKVRGAMFNILRGAAAVDDARVLDGFCGSGALGLEALSQGAAHVSFVDKAKTSLDLAKENAQALGAQDACRFVLKDAAKFTHVADPFDLIFLDPPYGQGLVERALEALLQGNCLAKNAMCVIEAENSFDAVFPSVFSVFQEKLYGDTKVIFLRYEASGA